MDRLLAEIEARRGEMVELCRELVRIPTVNPPGAEYPQCVRQLGERLRMRGFEVRYLRAEGAEADCDAWPRINLLARRAGGRRGVCVHFNGHIDVVPAGSGWSVDPFAAELRDGRIYGRGSADMKGGIAAALIALETITDLFPDFPGALEFSATVDEESGGFAGVGWLAEHGWFDPARVQHVIIPEPLDPDRVCIGHRGVWWAEIEIRGRTAHGSMPFLGDCAIRHTAAFIQALERELLPRLGRRHTRMPVVPEPARRSTLNLNSVHGGQPELARGLPSPCVADRCRLVIDRRFLVEERPEEVRGEILALLDRLARERPGFGYELRELLRFDPVLADGEGVLPQCFRQAVGEIFGREAPLVCSPGTYDHKHIARTGGLESCIAYGPGRLVLAHQPDEHVVIDDMVKAAQVMALATTRLLAVS